MRDYAHLLVLTVLLGCAGMTGCRAADPPAPATNPAEARLALPDQPLPAGFSRYYQPVSVSAPARAPGYSLPLDLSKVVNQSILQPLSAAQRAGLRQNGFVITGRLAGEDIAATYERIEDAEDPVWATPDAVLHLFHIQFDETLRTIEEEKLIPALLSLTQRLQQDSEAQYGSFEGGLKEAAKRNLAFFSVARALLEPGAAAPEPVADAVGRELALIEAHQGFAGSPVFGYREDYSQYVPRGHYTRSDQLKAYFKAMMWYGRLVFLIKGQDVSPNALVSAEEARSQTLSAALIASLLYAPAAGEEPTPADTWQRIYLVTAFFAGFADDLTPYQYAEAVKQVCGVAFAWSKLAEPSTFAALREKLAALPRPKIYGGTGEVTLFPPFSPQQLDMLLADTQGLRVMGQRYTPDSYVFQQLVFPVVGPFQGQGKPFTTEPTQGGPQRVFARGLDVMAVLGSDRALAILKEEGDTAYGNYDKSMTALRQEFGALGAADWGRNLYMGWIYALQALIQPRPEGYPTFMRTVAWEDRQLQAALASWAQLRHDTILYAKQPYVPRAGAAPAPAAPTSVGNVEPQPEFYARLLALTNSMKNGLQDLGLLSETVAGRLDTLAGLLSDLLDASQRELAGQALTPEQENMLKHFSWRLKAGLREVDDTALKATIIADVLTDINTGQVLEEGTGYVREILLAYSDPQGKVFVGRGATLSYYEFKHPMADRLTDEAWRERLKTKPPEPPEWVRGILSLE